MKCSKLEVLVPANRSVSDLNRCQFHLCQYIFHPFQPLVLPSCTTHNISQNFSSSSIQVLYPYHLLVSILLFHLQHQPPKAPTISQHPQECVHTLLQPAWHLQIWSPPRTIMRLLRRERMPLLSSLMPRLHLCRDSLHQRVHAKRPLPKTRHQRSLPGRVLWLFSFLPSKVQLYSRFSSAARKSLVRHHSREMLSLFDPI